MCIYGCAESLHPGGTEEIRILRTCCVFYFSRGRVDRASSNRCETRVLQGALAGGVAGLLTAGVLMTGAQLYSASGQIYYGAKVTTVEGCISNLTSQLK